MPIRSGSIHGTAQSSEIYPHAPRSAGSCVALSSQISPRLLPASFGLSGVVSQVAQRLMANSLLLPSCSRGCIRRRRPHLEPSSLRAMSDERDEADELALLPVAAPPPERGSRQGRRAVPRLEGSFVAIVCCRSGDRGPFCSKWISSQSAPPHARSSGTLRWRWRNHALGIVQIRFQAGLPMHRRLIANSCTKPCAGECWEGGWKGEVGW